MSWQDRWEWWQRGVIYQIYPRSFQDSNGDGCGDLRGIIKRLDYLAWLGVEAVWISPFYPSPMKDFGYDISDYKDVHPLFGKMADFDELLAEAHRRNLKVILDLVPNHTSDQHPWFLESASSTSNPKRNWYIWSDPAPDGGPPNNWISEFAGSAWEWHEGTQQYYYHAFLKEQPDLNWRHPEVRAAFYQTMRFWLDKGVDGFRVDVMWHMIKDEHLRNNPHNPDYDPERDSPYHEVIPVYSADQPEVHNVVREMRLVVDEYKNRLLIGEIYLPIEKLVTYYGNEESEAHLPFNFQLIGAPWDADHIRSVVDTYEASLRQHDWPNWVLGNHDKPRLASRIGREQAGVAAMLLLTLRGTPTLYYGDEIGMVDGNIPQEQVKDPRELNCPGRGLGRDPARTPMQWDNGPSAHFTEGVPWLPVNSDYREHNVGDQQRDEHSLLMLYHRLIELRRRESALAVGTYEPLESSANLLAYLRHDHKASFLVVLNLTNEPQSFKPRSRPGTGQVVISTHRESELQEVKDRIDLRPNEGIVVRLASPPERPASSAEGP
ncbi:DUF3459 domain-containing protein [Proteobacteria bacterium 005FR1]|nr:DUF3459 domain-containing protein [Proteobacteria bacterium 005FR1]